MTIQPSRPDTIRHRLIFALDVDTAKEAEELVTLLREEIGFFKVGKQLFLHAGPQVVHMIRDPRDVAASLLQKGWLKTERSGHDDVGAPYGGHARFWVEPERLAEFDGASEARRAGWAWRSYVTAARAASGNGGACASGRDFPAQALDGQQ